MVTTLEDIKKQFMRNPDQYVSGSPTIEAKRIDNSVCREATCDECGHVGLRYKPYIHKDNSREYHAFAECPKCGEAFAF